MSRSGAVNCPEKLKTKRQHAWPPLQLALHPCISSATPIPRLLFSSYPRTCDQNVPERGRARRRRLQNCRVRARFRLRHRREEVLRAAGQGDSQAAGGPVPALLALLEHEGVTAEDEVAVHAVALLLRVHAGSLDAFPFPYRRLDFFESRSRADSERSSVISTHDRRTQGRKTPKKSARAGGV